MLPDERDGQNEKGDAQGRDAKAVDSAAMRLRTVMAWRRVTGTSLAKMLGVSRGLVSLLLSDLEQGKRWPRGLASQRRCAQALSVPIEVLGAGGSPLVFPLEGARSEGVRIIAQQERQIRDLRADLDDHKRRMQQLQLLLGNALRVTGAHVFLPPQPAAQNAQGVTDASGGSQCQAKS